MAATGRNLQTGGQAGGTGGAACSGRRYRFGIGLAAAGFGLMLVGACAASGTASTAAATIPPPPAAAPAVPQPSFPEWLAGLRTEALQQGIKAATFDHAFAGVHLLQRVLELDSSQPEFSKPVWSYLDSAVSAQRVQLGRERLSANAALLSRVSKDFGVPPAILLAFWGIESDYGRDAYDPFLVIDALTTLAYQSRRPAFFRTELLAALRILDEGDVPLEQMRGSWAGAMGQPQFVPTIFLQHAVDYERNGHRDIWHSLPDIFASTAHFVSGLGWHPGESWGQEVRLPADFPWDQAELSIVKPVAEWVGLGVRPVAGPEPSASDAAPASILLPAGHTGPAFLVRENFRVIMRYNPAISYALAVALLADRITGAPPIATPWPRQEPTLSRSERLELQQRLAAQGFDPGGTDSLIGANTRTAIRGFQKTIKEIPDGFATRHLLEALRSRQPGQPG